jgi:hypothetical protein
MADVTIGDVLTANPVTSLAAGDKLELQTAGGSSAGITALDAFSILYGLGAVSVTGAVTATIGRLHYCTGTSANYTVALPAVSGNAGKLIGFAMAPIASLSKLVTIDGNGSEKIDDALTRIMWANESAILFCDGSNWIKIGGKSIPMQCQMYLNAGTQAISGSTVTKVNLDTAAIDNTSLMADTTNHLLTIRRPATYQASAQTLYASLSAAAALIQSILNKNAGTTVGAGVFSGAIGSYVSSPVVKTLSLALGDTVQLDTFHNVSGGVAHDITGGNTVNTLLSVVEVCGW